jgi:citrate synthase
LHDRDPRAVALIAQAGEWDLAGPHLQLAEALAGEIKIALNIDGAIAGIISDMGIDWRYGRTFFMIPRVLGLAAHAVEEVTRERPFRAIDIKDVAYDGPPERELPEGFKKK